MRGFNAFVFILIVDELKVIIDVKLNLSSLLQYLIHELHSLFLLVCGISVYYLSVSAHNAVRSKIISCQTVLVG